MRYEHPPIASLLIGAAQEADLVSPDFEQSRAISNRSTLDFTLHYGEQRIVHPGDASWKRLCFSSVPPDDDEGVRGSAWAHEISRQSMYGSGNAAPKSGKFPLYGKESPHRGEPFDRFLQLLGAFIRPTILYYCFTFDEIRFAAFIAEKPRVGRLP